MTHPPPDKARERSPYPARATIQAGAMPGGIAVEIECVARR